MPAPPHPSFQLPPHRASPFAPSATSLFSPVVMTGQNGSNKGGKKGGAGAKILSSSPVPEQLEWRARLWKMRRRAEEANGTQGDFCPVGEKSAGFSEEMMKRVTGHYCSATYSERR